MHLNNYWFVIIAVLWCGFFVLEGFDFGVGMLHSFVTRDETDRRVMVNSIGPFWDGNEVWLIVAGAAIFAAFPGWYASMFSAFYLALLLILVALIGRGLSFEFARKVEDPRWRATWRWSLTVGSLLVPLLLGTALGDLLHGLPIDASHNYTGNFFDLLVPFGLYTGATLTAICLFLGTTFLALKTVGPLRARAVRLSAVFGWIAFLVTWGWLTWSHVGLGRGFLPSPFDALAFMALLGGALLAEAKAEGWAFAAAAVGIASVVASIFFDLFPNVMISSTNAAYNVTIANSASPSYTLKVMTIVTVVFFPIVLAYQGWNLWVFRHRLGAAPQGADAAPDAAVPAPDAAVKGT